jgi:hypothetical protein
MTGPTIQSRSSIPVGVLLIALLAAGLDVLAAITGNAEPLVLSLWPWLTAGALWLTRPRPFRARLAEAALEVDEPPLSIPYADFQGLLAPRRPANPFKAGPRSYPMQVIHAGGVLRIPARLEVPSDEVFGFLYRTFSPGGSRDVPRALADYLRRKEWEFGPDRVWSYKARAHLGLGDGYHRAAAFFLAFALSGALWVVWGVARREEGWVGGGIAALLVGALLALLFWLASGRPQGMPRIRRWRESGLVVTPEGLALVQGDLTGELTWREVKDVTLRRGMASFQYSFEGHGSHKGIVLEVEGALIVIADLYDRPLSLIHQQIHYYWRGEPAGAEDGGAPPRGAARPGEGITPLD